MKVDLGQELWLLWSLYCWSFVSLWWFWWYYIIDIKDLMPASFLLLYRSDESGSGTGAVVAVIVVLLIICIAVVVLVVLYKRHQGFRKRMQPHIEGLCMLRRMFLYQRLSRWLITCINGKISMTSTNSGPLNAAYVSDVIHGPLDRYDFGFFFERKNFSSTFVIHVWPLVGSNYLSMSVCLYLYKTYLL